MNTTQLVFARQFEKPGLKNLFDFGGYYEDFNVTAWYYT
jgi:hypothetical protein